MAERNFPIALSYAELYATVQAEGANGAPLLPRLRVRFGFAGNSRTVDMERTVTIALEDANGLAPGATGKSTVAEK